MTRVGHTHEHVHLVDPLGAYDRLGRPVRGGYVRVAHRHHHFHTGRWEAMTDNPGAIHRPHRHEPHEEPER